MIGEALSCTVHCVVGAKSKRCKAAVLVAHATCCTGDKVLTPSAHGCATGALAAARALLVSQTTMLWSAIRRRSVWAPMIFTFFWSVRAALHAVPKLHSHLCL